MNLESLTSVAQGCCDVNNNPAMVLKKQDMGLGNRAKILSVGQQGLGLYVGWNRETDQKKYPKGEIGLVRKGLSAQLLGSAISAWLSAWAMS